MALRPRELELPGKSARKLSLQIESQCFNFQGKERYLIGKNVFALPVTDLRRIIEV